MRHQTDSVAVGALAAASDAATDAVKDLGKRLHIRQPAIVYCSDIVKSFPKYLKRFHNKYTYQLSDVKFLVKITCNFYSFFCNLKNK